MPLNWSRRMIAPKPDRSGCRRHVAQEAAAAFGSTERFCPVLQPRDDPFMSYSPRQNHPNPFLIRPPSGKLRHYPRKLFVILLLGSRTGEPPCRGEGYLRRGNCLGQHETAGRR